MSKRTGPDEDDDAGKPVKKRQRLTLAQVLPFAAGVPSDVASSLLVLPPEMQEEIVQQLLPLPDAMPDLSQQSRLEIVEALRALGITNTSLRAAVSNVIRRWWATSYMTLKRAVTQHDWRRSCDLANEAGTLNFIMRFLEDAGLSVLTQFDRFGASHWTRVDEATTLAIFLKVPMSNVDRLIERWRLEVDTARRTFARLLWYVLSRIPRPARDIVIKALMDAWSLVDLDECIAVTAFVTRTRIDAQLEAAWVALVIEHKLGLRQEIGLANIREAARDQWQTLAEKLYDFWMFGRRLNSGESLFSPSDDRRDEDDVAFDEAVRSRLLLN